MEVKPLANPLELLFEDKNIVLKIQRRLPFLFQLAEIESSRAGKTGMEAGSVREAFQLIGKNRK